MLCGWRLILMTKLKLTHRLKNESFEKEYRLTLLAHRIQTFLAYSSLSYQFTYFMWTTCGRVRRLPTVEPNRHTWSKCWEANHIDVYTLIRFHDYVCSLITAFIISAGSGVSKYLLIAYSMDPIFFILWQLSNVLHPSF